ncbi:hypothetical protein PVNG_06490 [Plasmodium vivax North Korean]|uniref:Variable surface protein Vir35 n=1 Tax=Plasmodium vivax North Korean TaxID=1035514 RepID=A0A0J9U135_PLAVI|nr:hypothetical protein PVNG_06490 [Plasmodium vivax North Korean]
MRHFRLLAIENGIPKELEYASCGNAFSYEKYKKLKMKKEDLSTYKRLKREGLNELDIYKKSFASKYSKKRGFTKLDCYCEKKIFDKIEGIRLLSKNMKDDKKCFKKICKRYGIASGLFIIFLYTLGIIITLDISNNNSCLFGDKAKEDTLIHIGCSILLYILPIIIFLVFAYIAIKIIKYDRLVLGKVEGKRIAKKISRYYDDSFNST